MIYHYLATTLLIVVVFVVLVGIGYHMPLRYVLLLVLGMYFFGVGIDIDHLDEGGYRKMIACGMYIEATQEYKENCSGLARHELHTMAVPIMLIIFLLTWLLHMKMDGIW